MTRYLVDNSVWQRLPRSAEVRSAVGALLEAEGELCCCALSLDEFGYSARSAADHRLSMDRLLSSFLFLPSSAAADAEAAAIRAALWLAGTGRAAGVVDVAIAAVAAAADAVVLHYDSDFDDITAAHPVVRSRWVVPRGSVD
ncbi:MAG TPA: PIN domain-containing protein [Nakamurella sp.]